MSFNECLVSMDDAIENNKRYVSSFKFCWMHWLFIYYKVIYAIPLANSKAVKNGNILIIVIYVEIILQYMSKPWDTGRCIVDRSFTLQVHNVSLTCVSMFDS